MIRMRVFLWVLVALVAGVFALFAYQLQQPKDEFVESAMIGQPIPAFDLPPIVADRPGLSSRDLADGQPKLLNVFASWCLPCIAEAPQLMALKRRGVPSDAIAIRDRPEDVAAFLARWGDPYQRIASDPHTQVQIALGSAGVPETFIVDGRGIIRHQHIGDIRPEHVDGILAAYEAAR